jgi:hypothetical protein
VTPCSVVVGYRRFEGPCCLRKTETGLHPEPNETSPRHPIPAHFSKTHSNIILLSIKFYVNFSFLLCMLHFPTFEKNILILFSYICLGAPSGQFPPGFQIKIVYAFLISPSMLQISFFKDYFKYEGVSKSFWTGRLQLELQMVRLSATRCSCVNIL